jgi:hypothetical protein
MKYKITMQSGKEYISWLQIDRASFNMYMGENKIINLPDGDITINLKYVESIEEVKL